MLGSIPAYRLLWGLLLEEWQGQYRRHAGSPYQTLERHVCHAVRPTYWKTDERALL